MSACLPYIQTIYPSECLSDSLAKINSNFTNLQNEVCGVKQTVDSMVEVRTFWYYGPNAQNDPSSGMQTGVASRPSDNTIKAFVNSPEQLNLPAISFVNDIAFVVFQKTGFQNNLFNNVTVSHNFGEHTGNLINFFAPTFFIWRLTFDGSEYIITPGSPAITRALTTTSGGRIWNQPQTWTTY
jgi:hypothetical protein